MADTSRSSVGEKVACEDNSDTKPRPTRSNDSSRSNSVLSDPEAAETPSHIQSTLSRTESKNSARRLELRQTQSAGPLARLRSRNPHLPFDHPLAHEKTRENVIVDFDGPDDPYRPMNWPTSKKIYTTVIYGLVTMGVTFASSVYSAGTSQVAADFGVGEEVATLGTSLLLFGLGLGPLIWGPCSELYGRRPAVLLPYFVSTMFAFGGGAAKDIQTVLICRFFQGFFGGAPVTNTGGVLGDLFSPEHRGIAIVGYAMAVVGGPTLGPIVSGAVCDSYLRWRWTQYLTGIYQIAILIIATLVTDESYAPALLTTKAQRLRHATGNWALHAKHEEWDASLKEMAHKYLVRPFQLIMTPICFLVCLYASFCFGILYACLGAFPFAFEEVRGWNKLVGALPFLCLLLGVFLGAGINIMNQKFYVKRWRANKCRAVPEARLPPMMAGSLLFVTGLFIFAWTAKPSIFWLVPCVGIVLMGTGFFTIFQGALNYLIDTFQRYSASAVAANTFLRSCFAGAFPLFITPMLKNLGVGWGVSIFGFVACALVPVPYLFYIYGKRIRARGVWSRDSVTD